MLGSSEDDTPNSSTECRSIHQEQIGFPRSIREVEPTFFALQRLAKQWSTIRMRHGKLPIFMPLGRIRACGGAIQKIALNRVKGVHLKMLFIVAVDVHRLNRCDTNSCQTWSFRSDAVSKLS